MNGYESDESDEMEALMGAFGEADEADEADPEQVRRSFYRPPRTAPGRVPPRPLPPTTSGNFVTQVQLQAALAGIASQIRTNSEALKTLSSRIATANRDEARAGAALKKEAVQRKKDIANLTNNVQMSMLFSLMLQPKSITTTQNIMGAPGAGVDPAVQINAGTKLTTAGDNTLGLLLPFMLLGGGLGTGSGMGGMGDQNNMMMMMLLLVAIGGLGGK
jgi:hypothetical protein